MDIHIQPGPNPVKSKGQNPIGFGFSPIHFHEYSHLGHLEMHNLIVRYNKESNLYVQEYLKVKVKKM